MKKRYSVLLMLALLVGCAAPAEEPPAEEPDQPVLSEEPAEPPEPIVSTLAVCGDVMTHLPLTRDAWDETQQRYDYGRIMAAAAPYVAAADYAVANLETTMAGGPSYSGYPAFNAPDDLAASLKDVGFDLLLTANNHCMDKGNSGLRRTLDVLDEAGLAHVGTSRTQEEYDNHCYVADVGGISVAFLGYTYGTNGLPLPSDAPYAVNLFNTDYLTTLSTPDSGKLLADLAAARALEPDLVAVMIHWGVEYQTSSNHYQDEIAELLLENGADIVLGGHSHVPQPMELRTRADGSTGFVCYSLGNFVSTQNDRLTDLTAVLTLELTRDMETGEAAVTGYSYQPMLMLDRESGPERFELLDIHRELAADGLTDAMERKLTQALEDCHGIWGEAADSGAPAAGYP